MVNECPEDSTAGSGQQRPQLLLWVTASAVTLIGLSVLRHVVPAMGLSWDGAVWLANHVVTCGVLESTVSKLAPHTPSKESSPLLGGEPWLASSTCAVLTRSVPAGRRAIISAALWFPLFSGASFAAVRFLLGSSRRGEGDRSTSQSSNGAAGGREFKQGHSTASSDTSSKASTMSVSSAAAAAAEATRPGPVPSLALRLQQSQQSQQQSQQLLVSPRASPPSAASRKLDSVSLAIVTPCALADLNAFLTAGCKYFVRNVIVLFGNAKRPPQPPNEASPTGPMNKGPPPRRLIGSTPRQSNGAGSAPPLRRLAQVTQRNLEFIGRFERSVDLCEVSDGVPVSQFIDVNIGDLHGPHDAPAVTVAVHRHPVAGACRLIEFTHPPSVVYCFAKEYHESDNSHPSPAASVQGATAAPSVVGSPIRPYRPVLDPSAVDDFASPTTTSRYAHIVLRPSVSCDALEELGPEDDSLAFCQQHVYLSGTTAHNTLPSAVNMVLYDRAIKSRRAQRSSVSVAPPALRGVDSP